MKNPYLSALMALSIYVSMVALLPSRSRATGVVNNPTETDLRAAMAGGGIVTFTCNGTILLTSTLSLGEDATIDASEHQITISGNNSFRVIDVGGPAHVTLLNLTIADGLSTNGGAILNNEGVVTLINCTFTNNSASGQNGIDGVDGTNGGPVVTTLPVASGGDGTPGSFGGGAQGGAIFNAGELFATNTLFIHNSVRGGARR